MLKEFLQFVENQCETRNAEINYEKIKDEEVIDKICDQIMELVSYEGVYLNDCYDLCYDLLMKIPEYCLRCILNKIDGFCVKPFITKCVYSVFIDHFTKFMFNDIYSNANYLIYMECMIEWIKYCREHEC